MSVINDTLLAIKAFFDTGVELFSGSAKVSQSNPLPTVSMYGTTSSAVLDAMFHLYRAIVPPASAKYATLQVYNKSDSTKRIVLVTLSVANTVSATNTYRAYTYNTELTTLASTQPINCSVGDVASAAVVKYENLDTLATNPNYNEITATTTALTAAMFGAAPIVLGPGEGFAIQCVTANTGFGALVQYNEVPL